jgi:chromosome segregation ATPase
MSEDVAAIKAAIDDIKEKLSKIENKRGSIRDSVYQKVKRDYEVRLGDLNGQLAGKKESLKESLKEITTKKQPLKSKLDVLQEQLEEIELRHSIGEYSDAQYDSMSGEIKEKMSEIEKDLESIKKEEKETKELLGEHGVDVEEEIESEEIEEETEEEKAAEEVQEEPLPEVSKEDMIAEELFTGKEKTVEESESVISNASAAEEENKAMLEVQEGNPARGAELFDLSKEKGKEEAKKEPPEGSAEEEDWLSSLEQELNEEAEEEKNVGKTEKAGNAEKNEEELVSICPKCNYKNRPDAWYCENCGSELTSPE